MSSTSRLVVEHPWERSPHLRAAEQGRRRTPWWLAVLVGVVAVLLGSLFTVRVVTAPDSSAVVAALSFLPVLVLPYLVRTLVVWGWVAKYERRRFRTLGFPGGKAAQALRGAAVGLVALGVVVALLAALGAVERADPRPGFSGATALGGVLILLAGWSVQATAEEVLYRGFLLQALARYGVGVGVAVSSLVFAAAHPGAYGNVLAALNLVLVGVLLAFWALAEGGLWGVCGFHLVWNWAQGSVFGFEVSGSTPAGGSLLALQTSGGSVLTGGDFGPEASLITSGVLLVLLALLVGLRRRARSRPRAGG